MHSEYSFPLHTQDRILTGRGKQAPRKNPFPNLFLPLGNPVLDGCTFHPIYGILLADIITDKPFRIIGNEIFMYPDGFQYLTQANAIAGASLVARMREWFSREPMG